MFCSVAAEHEENKMNISNLSVCFGPTLLRPEEETVAAIMDIKFCNVVVEILIENYSMVSLLRSKHHLCFYVMFNLVDLSMEFKYLKHYHTDFDFNWMTNFVVLCIWSESSFI